MRSHPLRGQTAEQKASDQQACGEYARRPAEGLITQPSHSIVGTVAMSMILSSFERCMKDRGYDVEQPTEYSARPRSQ
jgi:hypothetical protein